MERAIFARVGLLTLLASTCLTAISPALAADPYSFTTFNNPGDPNFNQLLGINNAGTIGGYFGDGTVVPNNGYTFVRPSTYTPENFPGSVQTQVVGINSLSPPTTVGFYIDSAGNNFGFTDLSGTFTQVMNPSTPTTGTTTTNFSV
jgi:hypothetical protein